MQSNVIN